MTQHRNVIIVGSGPAGYTAALYTARADLAPLVFEGASVRRRPDEHHRRRELPGLPRGHHGPGSDDPDPRPRPSGSAPNWSATTSTSVDLTGPVKIVRTHGGEYTADAVILATGSAYRKLGLPREDELSGHGVSWCATCDGFFFRDSRHRRRRRRRHRDGGGDLPDPVRQVGHRRAPPRLAAREPDHGRPRRGEPQDQVGVELRGRRHPRRGHRHRDPAARHRDRRGARPRGRRAVHRDRARAAQRAGPRPARPGRRGLHRHHDRHQDEPATACSRPATSSTTSTVRRSPPRAPAARPRWTPSAISAALADSRGQAVSDADRTTASA